MMISRSSVALLLLLAGSCAKGPSAAPVPGGGAVAPAPATGSNSLTDAERAAGWTLLFDGTSLDAWRGYKQATVPTGWRAADGTLTKDRPVPDIVSKEQFGDFDLQLEWKIGEAGNSGIFYRGSEDEDRIYWTAPEYQLLDDIKASDNKTEFTRSGAVYALYAAPGGHWKPVGEWNVTWIIARGPRVEHWLNGARLFEYEVGSADWEARVGASKFKAWPKFAKNRKGHLAIQGDHRGSLSFRSIKIRRLD